MIRTNPFLPLNATAGIGHHSAIPGTTSGKGKAKSNPQNVTNYGREAE